MTKNVKKIGLNQPNQQMKQNQFVLFCKDLVDKNMSNVICTSQYFNRVITSQYLNLSHTRADFATQ
jgi:hypothetical protein